LSREKSRIMRCTNCFFFKRIDKKAAFMNAYFGSALLLSEV
jgi:hypothetical protein